MSADADLVWRSGDLKRELVEFAHQRRFERAFRRELNRHFGMTAPVDEAEFTNYLDWFILQHRLADGRTLVEHFAAQHPKLPEDERAMLLGWRDGVEGIFEVQGREGESLIVVNLVDELNYRVRSNMGPGVLARLRHGSFLISRIVPIGDEWLLSGMASVLPAASRAEAYRLAAELASQKPALVFRNPEKLAQAWELQREHRRNFIAFFGSDLVVLPGHELAERMRAYAHFCAYDVRGADGKTAAERAQEAYGVVPSIPDLELPADFREAETVGVISDEVDGLNFYANFGRVEETFANPDLLADRRHRQAVFGYLNESSIPPLPLRRLAERDPGRASRVFQRLLKQPGFSWERDGEALLRRYKASAFGRPVLPSILPLGQALARAEMGVPDTGAPPALRPAGRQRKNRTGRT